MHDFEYQNTISIFDIRAVSVFHVIMFKTFFGIQNVSKYQVFNIITNF